MVDGDKKEQIRRDEEFVIARLLELRREENTRFWTVFSILSITNGVLINAAVADDTTDTLKLGVVGAGFLLSVIWTAIQYRFAFYCRQWEKKIQDIQKEDIEKHKLLHIHGHPPWYSVSTKAGGYLNYVFMALWAGLLVHSL